LDNVQCAGTEARLVDCLGVTLADPVSLCSHDMEAGVTCQSACSDPDAIRLQGGTATSGRVEICRSGTWRSICGTFWEDVDARVACGELGLPSSGEFYGHAFGDTYETESAMCIHTCPPSQQNCL
jgi:deleted-in-malignant-brain-tumors protein 1